MPIVNPFDSPSTLGQRVLFPSLARAWWAGYKAGVEFAESRPTKSVPLHMVVNNVAAAKPRPGKPIF